MGWRVERRAGLRWVPLVLALSAVAGGIAWWVWPPSADPTLAEFRDALQRQKESACDGGTISSHREIKIIRGPDLPSGMNEAYELRCDVPGVTSRTLMVHYVFVSGADARAWLEDFDRSDDANYGWTLNDSTLAGRVTVPATLWQSVLMDLGIEQLSLSP